MILIVVEMMHAGVVRVQNMGVLDILQKIYANVMINALIMVIVVFDCCFIILVPMYSKPSFFSELIIFSTGTSTASQKSLR